MKRITRVAAAVAGAGVVAITSMVPAAAQDVCGARVVDEAGVLGEQRSEVDDAAAQLAEQGADARVIVVHATPQDDLDRYQAELEGGCESWRSGGERRPDLLVVMVAVSERSTGIYYGADLAPALDGRWLAVQTDVMNPRFGAGDFAAGLTAGLDAVGELLVVQEPRRTAPRGSNLVTLLGWLLGTLAVGGGVVGSVVVGRRVRQGHPPGERPSGARDPFTAVAAANAALHAGRSVHEPARAVQEGIAQRRQQANQATTAAEDAVGDARRYVRRHRFRTPWAARRRLTAAERILQQALASADLQIRIERAGAAERLGREALRRAHRGVSRRRGGGGGFPGGGGGVPSSWSGGGQSSSGGGGGGGGSSRW